MKKILTILALVFSTAVFAEFIDDIAKIDEQIQNNNYENALKLSKELMKTNLSAADRATLEALIQDIEAKRKTPSIDEALSALGDGTLFTSTETISTASKFEQYRQYEKQILSTNNEDAIHRLALLYVKEGLYESAMKLALKDKSKSVKNLYLAATSARMIGKYDMAINLYNQVLSSGTHYKSYLGLAMAYRGKGDFEKAESYMQQYNNVTY
ncbi:CDC27 family protein [Caviibacter abscessus]|uniref:CDC27 family protein n=1 Tax=Caviibacter abscessus TaxID=1766719 RepID=UPI00082C14C9|nr:CDC27 family protein [Caviibacter abscessus]